MYHLYDVMLKYDVNTISRTENYSNKTIHLSMTSPYEWVIY